MQKEESVPLHKVARGRRVLVVEVPEGKVRSQLIRLGILKGEFVKCLQRLPGGTVLVEKNRQEIAIGASLASAIFVTYAPEVL